MENIMFHSEYDDDTLNSTKIELLYLLENSKNQMNALRVHMHWAVGAMLKQTTAHKIEETRQRSN